jgi:tetratricopeptide (TPR) repeat protein
LLIQDEKQTYSFWTKPRPWVFILLVTMELLNFTFGARFFYDLGIVYKNRGWTEASRFLMGCATWSNGWDPYAKKAEVFSKICLPKKHIPQAVLEQNIDAFNLGQAGKTEEACRAFEDLIKAHPEFEWPYNNLAGIKIEGGKAEEARELCEKALAINPDYANAHITLGLALKELQQDDLSRKHLMEGKRLYAALGE